MTKYERLEQLIREKEKVISSPNRRFWIGLAGRESSRLCDGIAVSQRLPSRTLQVCADLSGAIAWMQSQKQHDFQLAAGDDPLASWSK